MRTVAWASVREYTLSRAVSHTSDVSDPPPGVEIRKLGNDIELRGRLTLAEGADDWIMLFVMPEGCRPDATIPCGVESESGALELWIEPDGSVWADSPRRGWIELEASFPAA